MCVGSWEVKKGGPFLGWEKKTHGMWSTSDFSRITVLTGDRDGCLTQAGRLCQLSLLHKNVGLPGEPSAIAWVY